MWIKLRFCCCKLSLFAAFPVFRISWNIQMTCRSSITHCVSTQVSFGDHAMTLFHCAAFRGILSPLPAEGSVSNWTSKLSFKYIVAALQSTSDCWRNCAFYSSAYARKIGPTVPNALRYTSDIVPVTTPIRRTSRKGLSHRCLWSRRLISIGVPRWSVVSSVP